MEHPLKRYHETTPQESVELKKKVKGLSRDMSGMEVSTSVDWDDDLSIAECNLRMLETETATDVSFMVGQSNIPIKAHKYILASRNSVFRTMFYGSIAEKDDVIAIPDVEPDIFSKMLKFFYTGAVEVNEGDVLPALYAARKYNVIKMAEKCSTFLENELAEHNVLGMLEHANKFNEIELQNKCLRFINRNANLCLHSPDFCFLSKESLDKIITSSSLEIDEEQIYECVMRWARAECGRKNLDANSENLRLALKNNLYNIRFPLLGPKVFTEKVVTSKLLTTDECLEVLCSFHSSKFPLTRFSAEKRNNKEMVLRCVRFRSKTTTNIWRYGENKCDSIKFKVNEEILLVGFTLHRSSKESTVKYTVKYTLLVNGTAVSPEDNQTIETKATKMEHDVYFSEAIALNAGDEYELKLFISGPYSIRGLDGLDVVKTNGVVFQFFDGSFTAEERTNVKVGQIPTLLFQHL